VPSSFLPGPILIVEDDRKTAALVAMYLEREGFHTLSAANGQQALVLAQQSAPSFVILDLMLPRVDGWDVCRELRRVSDVPILILTAREEEMDRVVGLSLGADDYVVKPFSPRELVARVKAILRRARPSPKTTDVATCGPLVLDTTKRKVTLHGQPVPLTLSEYILLQALMTAPGRVFSREELLNRLYPDGCAVIDRVIDVHIANLRRKIEADPAQPCYILTTRGIGYQFADLEDTPG
jgi:DNA-binding response OmpR family regulator